MAAEPAGDVESLLRSALRPIEPPENLSGRVEETLSAVTEAAAEELSAWAEELSESELRSLRDPRNWIRPAAAIAAGGGGAGGRGRRGGPGDRRAPAPQATLPSVGDHRSILGDHGPAAKPARLARLLRPS